MKSSWYQHNPNLLFNRSNSIVLEYNCSTFSVHCICTYLHLSHNQLLGKYSMLMWYPWCSSKSRTIPRIVHKVDVPSSLPTEDLGGSFTWLWRSEWVFEECIFHQLHEHLIGKKMEMLNLKGSTNEEINKSFAWSSQQSTSTWCRNILDLFDITASPNRRPSPDKPLPHNTGDPPVPSFDTHPKI